MNRVLWAVIGLVLLGGGVLGLLAGGLTSFVQDRQRTILSAEMVSTWNRHETLATILTIVGGLLLALLGGLLLRAQLRRRGPAPIDDRYVQLPPQPCSGKPTPTNVGSTEVASEALNRALKLDIERDRQVRRAGVQLAGPIAQPRLRLRLAVTPDADIARLAHHLDETMQRFTATSGIRPELSDVVVRIPERTPRVN
jgi:hypothetical protein